MRRATHGAALVGLLFGWGGCSGLDDTEAEAVTTDTEAVATETADVEDVEIASLQSPQVAGGANGTACTAAAQCASGQCVLHFQDIDNDEFAVVGAVTARFCGGAGFNKPGFTTRSPGAANATDCLDNNANVFPGQTRGFTVPAAGKATLPFDYNCDGRELATNALLNRFQNCADTSVSVCTSRGGYVGLIPACGQTGTFGPCANIPQQGACVGAPGGPAVRQPCL